MKRSHVLPVLLLAALVAFAQSDKPAADSSSKKASKSSSSANKPGTKTRTVIKTPAIMIKEFKPKDIAVPALFEMAMFVNTIEQVKKTVLFKEVYRDGDKRAAAYPDLVILECTVYQFKEGSARQRQVTTVSGASSVHVHLALKDTNGAYLLEKDVSGSVHFIGENLKVTQDLAKNIAALVNEKFL